MLKMLTVLNFKVVQMNWESSTPIVKNTKYNLVPVKNAYNVYHGNLEISSRKLQVME